MSRAWRALLTDTTIWERVDLSSSAARFSEALLRAAVANAGGQLRALDTNEQPRGDDREVVFVKDPLFRLIHEVVAANAGTLTELRLYTKEFWSTQNVRWLLEAAPALQLLELSVVIADRQVARDMLRNEPPFQALRLQRLTTLRGLQTTVDVVAFSSELRCHASLEYLFFWRAALDPTAAMGAVVDACIALRLRGLMLRMCRVMPASLSELTRLIDAGALRELIVQNGIAAMFEAGHESTRLFVAAVRASAMTKLQLSTFVAEVPESVVEAAAFINARRQ